MRLKLIDRGFLIVRCVIAALGLVGGVAQSAAETFATPRCVSEGGCMWTVPYALAASERFDVIINPSSGVPSDAIIPSYQTSVDGSVIRISGSYVPCHCGTFGAAPPIFLSVPIDPLAPGRYTIVFTASPDPSYGSVGWVYTEAGEFVQAPIRMTGEITVLSAASANKGTERAVEFYHWPLDHYFVTSNAEEIAALDGGSIEGWKRTGERFTVLSASNQKATGAAPVCRFYGSPEAGLDSHFFSASVAECDSVMTKYPQAWILESPNAFMVELPDQDTGACPEGTLPVYRLYNNQSDANHRYTTSRANRDIMTAIGWIAEGYGPQSVAMCALGN